MINHYTVDLRMHFHCHPDDISKFSSLLAESENCASYKDINFTITKLFPITEIKHLASHPNCFICDERFTDHIPEQDEELFI